MLHHGHRQRQPRNTTSVQEEPTVPAVERRYEEDSHLVEVEDDV